LAAGALPQKPSRGSVGDGLAFLHGLVPVTCEGEGRWRVNGCVFTLCREGRVRVEHRWRTFTRNNSISYSSDTSTNATCWRISGTLTTLLALLHAVTHLSESITLVTFPSADVWNDYVVVMADMLIKESCQHNIDAKVYSI